MVGAIQNHVRSLNWGYKVQLCQKNIKYYNEFARFVDNHTLTLTDKSGNKETVTARNVVLAMGGSPNHLDVPRPKKYYITRLTLHKK